MFEQENNDDDEDCSETEAGIFLTHSLLINLCDVMFYKLCHQREKERNAIFRV